MTMQVTQMALEGKQLKADFTADELGNIRLTISQIHKNRDLYNDEILEQFFGEDRVKPMNLIAEYREDLLEISELIELRHSSQIRPLMDYADRMRASLAEEGEEVDV